jgi:hypothetical protein
MGLESLRRNSSILILSKRPLVDDSGVSGIVEYAGCDPRLRTKRGVSIHYTHRKRSLPKKKKKETYFEHQPSSKAHAADFLRPIREARVERR